MNECELAKIKGKDGESWYKGKKIKRKVQNETRFPDTAFLIDWFTVFLSTISFPL
jgi:hypothetical protein